MAWDNIVVEQHGSGCNPGLKVANGYGLVGAQKNGRSVVCGL